MFLTVCRTFADTIFFSFLLHFKLHKQQKKKVPAPEILGPSLPINNHLLQSSSLQPSLSLCSDIHLCLSP